MVLGSFHTPSRYDFRSNVIRPFKDVQREQLSFAIYFTLVNGCTNELVVSIFRTTAGVKGKKIYTCNTYRGSNMSAHVLLNLLNGLGKIDKMRGLPSILSLFATSLINSIIQEHEC